MKDNSICLLFVNQRKTCRTIDIVVARQVEDKSDEENVSDEHSINGKLTGLDTDDIENQQPLSLLALHDEEDLINLSSSPLRPIISNKTATEILPRKTVIRIDADDDEELDDIDDCQIQFEARIFFMYWYFNTK